MTAIYSLAIRAYGVMMRLAAYFHPKAAEWCKGRQELRLRYAQNKPAPTSTDRAWVHCASLGEFEQARPLIEALHQAGWEVFLTFFSPSGYNQRKDYPLAYEVSYLPLDTATNARSFIEYVQPHVAIFIRYEFWYFHLGELHQRKIPTYLASASFRPSQPFFRPIIGQWFRKMLNFYDGIFTIDEASLQLLSHYGINKVEVAGDSRADRVLQIARQPKSITKVATFKQQSRHLIVCGSTWPQDIAKIIPSIQALGAAAHWVIAPHEVSASSIRALQSELEAAGCPHILYSDDNKNEPYPAVLIIDNVGMLAHIYQYADVAIVGGGWGKGIHNVLEPAAHAVPVIWGPKCQKFPEALGLAHAQGGAIVQQADELHAILHTYMSEEEKRKQHGQLALAYVEQLAGATQHIMQYINQKKPC